MTARCSRNTVRLIVTVTAVLVAVTAAIPLWGHAVVFPGEAPVGAYQKYVLRVPNERDAATTEVRLTFPADVRVISFADVVGWELEIARDGDGSIVEAVWTGALPPSRFVEFPFVAVNPAQAATLVWPAKQTYANGETVAWNGPEDSPTPASVTLVGQGPAAVGAAGGFTPYLSGAAVLLSLLALGVAIRRRD